MQKFIYIALIALCVFAANLSYATDCTTKSDFPAKISWDNTADRLFEVVGGLVPGKTSSVEFVTGDNPDASGVLSLIETEGSFTAAISACPGEFAAVYCSSVDEPLKITTGPARNGFCKLEPNSRYYYNIKLNGREAVYFVFKFMHTR